jgi:putative PIN family toxin of toxin-antitoxin system
VRVVLDTNVFVASLAFPGGQGDKALRAVWEGGHPLVLSSAILAELADVLVRKFHWDRDKTLDACRALADIAEIVHPQERLSLLKDEPDNRILEAAAAGKADVVVTGDKHMLGLKRFGNVRIVSLAEFLREVWRL